MKHVPRGVFVVAVASALVATTAGAQEREPRPERERAIAAARQEAQRGWLGLSFNYEREGTGDRARERAVITEVHPGSPAERAGLRRDDAIVRVNGHADIEARVRALRLQPGDTVRLRVQRQGQRDRDVAVVAERMPASVAIASWPREGQRFEVRRLRRGEPGTIIVNGDTIRIPMDSLMVHADSLQRQIRVLIADSLGPRLRRLERRMEHDLGPELRERMRMLDSAMVRAFPDGFVFEVGRRAVAGAEFTALNPELAEYFQGAREGLLVTRVAPESPAARAGLQAGDVVTRANGQAVRSTAELRRAVSAAGRDEVRLGVVRRGRQLELRMR